MGKQARIIIAVVILIVIIAAGWWWYVTKDTVKVALTSILPASAPANTNTALALTGTTSSKSSPATWSGRTVKIHTKSLGRLKSSVASATSATGGGVTITTQPISFAGGFNYASDPADYARVYLKL
jgi:hypothetical protein